MSAGKWLMLLGLSLFVAGLVLTYAPNLFGWFGKLPGDIRIEGKNGFVFVPITSISFTKQNFVFSFLVADLDLESAVSSLKKYPSISVPLHSDPEPDAGHPFSYHDLVSFVDASFQSGSRKTI